MSAHGSQPTAQEQPPNYSTTTSNTPQETTIPVRLVLEQHAPGTSTAHTRQPGTSKICTVEDAILLSQNTTYADLHAAVLQRLEAYWQRKLSDFPAGTAPGAAYGGIWVTWDRVKLSLTEFNTTAVVAKLAKLQQYTETRANEIGQAKSFDVDNLKLNVWFAIVPEVDKATLFSEKNMRISEKQRREDEKVSQREELGVPVQATIGDNVCVIQ